MNAIVQRIMGMYLLKAHCSSPFITKTHIFAVRDETRNSISHGLCWL
uniref:Uncharacterized protein n=1 Tax=Anopheles funestus TaxID=62324 RepID=A0A182RQJ8_ANOFN